MKEGEDMSGKPLLLLDVDGVLNPDLSTKSRRRYGYDPRMTLRVTHGVTGQDMMLPYDYAPKHRDYLAVLRTHFDVVWATTWNESANEVLGPLYGLPGLPVMRVDSVQDGGRLEGELSHKTTAVVRYADGRPFVWVDDIVRSVDRRFLREQCPQPHLGYLVPAAVGLRGKDVRFLAAWSEALQAGAPLPVRAEPFASEPFARP